jgi:polyisoprenoid-binding protein YceI
MKHLIFIALASTISNAALAASETYTIDGNHTLPRFSYSHFGYSTQLSRFDKTAGKIVSDRVAKTGTVDITVDMTSVNTGSTLFNEHIQGKDFLDTAKYPTATFKSTQLKFAGDQLVAVDGTLTLKGISKPVSLKVTSFHCMPHPIYLKTACGANATAVVKRTDFDMGKYAPNVSDEVTIDIPVEATKDLGSWGELCDATHNSQKCQSTSFDIVSPFMYSYVLLQEHLINAPKRAKEVAKSCPETLAGVGVHLTDTVPVIIPCPFTFAGCMANCYMQAA